MTTQIAIVLGIFLLFVILILFYYKEEDDFSFLGRKRG